MKNYKKTLTLLKYVKNLPKKTKQNALFSGLIFSINHVNKSDINQNIKIDWHKAASYVHKFRNVSDYA